MPISSTQGGSGNTVKKVLIVGGLRNFMAADQPLFKRSDFKLITVGTAQEALDIHRAQKVDLIIASLHMYGIAGDELCSMIRKEKDLKYVSFILVCTNTQSDRDRAVKCKANDYIVFPISAEELMVKVSKYLNVQKRQSYRVLLKIELHGEVKHAAFFCHTKDLSASGLMIETDKVLKKGDIISCSFFLPKSGQIAADAEVVRIQKQPNLVQYGLRFTTISPKSRSSIEKFIADHK